MIRPAMRLSISPATELDAFCTAPPSIPLVLGTGGIEWAAIAAGSLAFLIPVVIITFVLRKHLLRGVTFGAIRKG